MTVTQHESVKVEVVATEASLSFYSIEEIEKTGVRVWRNKDEWGAYVRHRSNRNAYSADIRMNRVNTP